MYDTDEYHEIMIQEIILVAKLKDGYKYIIFN